jgi:porin
LSPLALLFALAAVASPSPSASPDAVSPNTSPSAAADQKAPAQIRKPDVAATASAPAFPGLLGDFGGGARSDLAAHGVKLNAHLVTEAAANASGGFPLGGTSYARGTAISSEFGFGFDADLSKLAHINDAGTLHFLLTTRFGSNLSSEAVGNLSSVQEIYGDGQTTRITFFDYEQPIAHDRFNLRLGKYNQQNDFIAGSTYWGGNLYCFYQNNTICGTPASIPVNNGVVQNGSEGYTYYPSSQWGARLRAKLGNATSIEGAVIEGNPRVNNQNGGLYLGFNGATGVELPVELDETLADRSGAPVGNVRIGGYYDTSDVLNFASRAASSLTLTNYETTPAGLASNAAALATLGQTYVRGRSGAYIQADHIVEGSAAPGASGTALFASVEYSDPQTSLISTFFEVGAVRHGTFKGRPNDTIAAAFATQDYNVRLQRLELALQSQGFAVPNTVHDQVVELDYGFSVASWFTLRPGLQYVIDPSGVTPSPANGVLNPARNALVIGLGSYITF